MLFFHVFDQIQKGRGYQVDRCRFKDEPLYQFYHCKTVAQQMLTCTASSRQTDTEVCEIVQSKVGGKWIRVWTNHLQH